MYGMLDGNILTEMDCTEEAVKSYDRGLELCLEEKPDASTWNRERKRIRWNSTGSMKH